MAHVMILHVEQTFLSVGQDTIYTFTFIVKMYNCIVKSTKGKFIMVKFCSGWRSTVLYYRNASGYTQPQHRREEEACCSVPNTEMKCLQHHNLHRKLSWAWKVQTELKCILFQLAIKDMHHHYSSGLAFNFNHVCRTFKGTTQFRWVTA